MTEKQHRHDDRSKWFELKEVPAHELEALLSLIEVSGRYAPTPEQWAAILRQAEAIRDYL